MDLIVEKPTIAYNLSQIQPGYLFYAKHNTWDSGKAGFVTSITEKQVTVQYHPEACPGPEDSAYIFDEFLANIV